MKRLLRIYPAFCKNSFAAMVQYRMAMGIWLLHVVIEPVIYLVVWSTVAKARQGSVGGFDAGEIAGYYLVMMLVNHFSFTWIMWEFDFKIRTGALSFALLRPVHPIHEDISDNITYKMVTMTVMIPTAIVLAFVFHPKINPQAWAVVAFVPALLMGYLLRFLIEWTIALAAFWTTRTVAINETYYVFLLFLSGRLAPMALLPLWIRRLADILPFRWILNFPVELILGRLPPAEAVAGLAIQAAWLSGAFILVWGGWRVAVRQYSAVGA